MSAPIARLAGLPFWSSRLLKANLPIFAQLCPYSLRARRMRYLETIKYQHFLETGYFLKVSQCTEIVRRMSVLSGYMYLTDHEVKNQILALTDKFMEARELLSDAEEVKNTVYFSDDMQEAEVAVKETLQEYEELLSKLSEEQAINVNRTIGLKMLELQAQYDAIKESLLED